MRGVDTPMHTINEIFSLKHSRLKINGTESKMSDKKKNHLRKKSNLAEAVHMKNIRNIYKDKVCGENAQGKVIKKFEFIENG